MEKLVMNLDPNTPSSTEKTTYGQFRDNNSKLNEFLEFITKNPAKDGDEKFAAYYKRMARVTHTDRGGTGGGFSLLGSVWGFFTKGNPALSDKFKNATLTDIIKYIQERLTRVQHAEAVAANAAAAAAAAAAAMAAAAAAHRQ